MYYRLVAPADFFESPQYPSICPFTGSAADLTPIDLDLSFVRARSIPPLHHNRGVEDLITDDSVFQALRGRARKTSRNLLLTFPANAAAFRRWRLHNRWIPLLLLACPPLAAMATALILPAWELLYWVLGAILVGLALGMILAAHYRRRQVDSPEFAVSPHGYVVITLPESRQAVARQLAAAVQNFLAAGNAPTPAATETTGGSAGTVVNIAADSDIAIVESHS